MQRELLMAEVYLFSLPRSVCSKMFFTDYGQIPKVERCDMDGQNRTKLVDSKIVFPHGITLDLVSRLVYWADAYLDYIEVVDYEGKNRHTVIQGLLVSREGLHTHICIHWTVEQTVSVFIYRRMIWPKTKSADFPFIPNAVKQTFFVSQITICVLSTGYSNHVKSLAYVISHAI